MGAARVGTAAMDLLQFARYRLGGGKERLLAWEFSAGLKDWGQAPAPAHIGKRVVEGIFQRQLPPERAALTNTWCTGATGSPGAGCLGWGGLDALPRVGYGLALGATVWTASYIFLPLAKLYRPIWEYDARVLAKDLGDRLVYGLGTAGAYRLLAGSAVAAGRAGVRQRRVAAPGHTSEFIQGSGGQDGTPRQRSVNLGSGPRVLLPG